MKVNKARRDYYSYYYQFEYEAERVVARGSYTMNT